MKLSDLNIGDTFCYPYDADNGKYYEVRRLPLFQVDDTIKIKVLEKNFIFGGEQGCNHTTNNYEVQLEDDKGDYQHYVVVLPDDPAASPEAWYKWQAEEDDERDPSG